MNQNTNIDRSLERDAYDQHGVLSGLVYIDTKDGDMTLSLVEERGTDNYWYLRGSRQRRCVDSRDSVSTDDIYEYCI